MTIQQIITTLEQWAPPALQESYDNCGLLTGNKNWNCSGVVCCLDVTEDVLEEAQAKKYNLIVAHHPIIFSGLKKIVGKNYVERIIIKAIKNDIAIYALHTNLDNVYTGVNAMMAKRLNLQQTSILAPKNNQLKKLYTYIIPDHIEKLKEGLFATGAGVIGNYSECSFRVLGEGTFKGNEHSNPKVGIKQKRSTVQEVKIEFLFPTYLEGKVIQALKTHHPYEEVAYEIVSLDNVHQEIGSGMVGYLEKPMAEKDFLPMVKKAFGLKAIRHTALLKKKIQKVALCGGSGSFLINNALGVKADAYITADVKYHEFFNADRQLLLLDIGHYESEQYTIELIFKHLQQKFPNFAVLKTRVNTNSVHYFVA